MLGLQVAEWISYGWLISTWNLGNYIKNGVIDATIKDEKVISELEQLRKRYGVIKPKMYIYYDRVSYKGIKDKKSSLNHW